MTIITWTSTIGTAADHASEYTHTKGLLQTWKADSQHVGRQFIFPIDKDHPVICYLRLCWFYAPASTDLFFCCRVSVHIRHLCSHYFPASWLPEGTRTLTLVPQLNDVTQILTSSSVFRPLARLVLTIVLWPLLVSIWRRWSTEGSALGDTTGSRNISCPIPHFPLICIRLPSVEVKYEHKHLSIEPFSHTNSPFDSSSWANRNRRIELCPAIMIMDIIVWFFFLSRWGGCGGGREMWPQNGRC